MKLRNKIVAFFLTTACAFGLAVANNATKVNAANFGATLPDNADAIATFTFGANGNAAHVDGNAYSGTKTYTDGDYSLAISNMAKVYGPAYDAKGNSAIKLGTSSVVGSFKFTAPEDVDYVAIHAAKYKSNTSKVSVNGSTYTLQSASNNGAYDMIVVDTTTTKAISFTTVSGGVRCMINTIEYYAVTVSEDVTDEERVAAAAEALKIETEIYDDINLPETGINDTTITWSSSDEDTLYSDGVVGLRDVEDTPVTLTATISYGTASIEKEIEVVVVGEYRIIDEGLAALSLPTSTIKNLTLPTTVANVASVTWESDDEEIISNTGKVTRPAQDTIVTLTATVRIGGLSDTKEFDVLVKKALEFVTAPKANTYYKMVVSQNTLGQELYLTGAMDGYYYATTQDVTKSILVYLLETTGGYHMVAKTSSGIKYMNIVISGTYKNVKYDTTPSSVWTFNSQYNTFTTKATDGNTYYIGTYGTYSTYSASAVSYLTSSTNYPAKLIELSAEEKAEVFGISARVGYQVGTKDESTALRLVAEFDFRAEDLPNYDAEISFKVTRNGVADERVVSKLYSSVNPMNDEEVLEGAYYAVLTYVNVPAGEYTVEVLIDGMVVASVVATVA